MAEKFAFEINIGDWSGDGHGQNHAYHIMSNKPVQNVREAYFAAKAKLPKHLCPEKFMCDYEDSSLPENVYRDALAMGFDFLDCFGDPKEGEALAELLRYPDWDSKRMCEYVLWFLRHGDPELELTLEEDLPALSFYGHDSKNRHIGYIGYGLFGG